MKRKEVEFTDDQYARIFTALSSDRKRQVLQGLSPEEIAIGEYKDPKIFKDIIQTHLIEYLDVNTYLTLGRTCRYFFKHFMVYNHPSCHRIGQYYGSSGWEMIDKFNSIRSDLENVFWHVFYDTIINGLQLPFVNPNIKSRADAKKSIGKNNFIKMTGRVYIHYPTGFICKSNGRDIRGNIFHPEGLNHFYMDEAAGYSKLKDPRTVSEKTKKQTQRWKSQYKLIHSQWFFFATSI